MEYLPLFHDFRLPLQTSRIRVVCGPGFIEFALLGHGFCDRLSSMLLIRRRSKHANRAGLGNEGAKVAEDLSIARPRRRKWPVEKFAADHRAPFVDLYRSVELVL
jgi:hypothetical protein